MSLRNPKMRFGPTTSYSIGQTASSFSIGRTASSSIGPQTASSSSSSSSSFSYDVFLSFRGKDTRNNFTDHLYADLVDNKIVTFIDDNIPRGERIDAKILQAIEESRSSIIIFSENYANSKWCLDELVKIMECNERGRKAFPIFYHVDPSDVETQSGNYGKAFADHENDENLERKQIEKWKTALTNACILAGYPIKDQRESQVVKKITKDVIGHIIGENCIEDGLVGKHRRLEALKERICESNDVLMVGIYGLSGTGKTTFARALYDEISWDFEGASFLANIGEVSKEDDLHCLQKRLFCDILLGENQEIRPFHRRNNLMKNKIGSKKVLIILDDVNNVKQLEILAGEHAWFGKGSRIIITTKNKHLLQHKVDRSYQIEELGTIEALQLFSHYANTGEGSRHGFSKLSNEVIMHCRLHPLNLKVLGSFLRGTRIMQRELLLEKVAKKSAGENFGVRVSLNGLSDEQRHIFLDVAGFFKGKHKDFVTKMLHESRFPVENEIQVLIDRCLITDSERKLWMHSIIQELGWQIVREKGKGYRILDHVNIGSTLRTKKEIHKIGGISLDLSKSKQLCFPTDVFERMTELKLLKVFLGSDYVDGEENREVDLDPDFILPGCVLRYLHWRGYQLESYPSNFEPEELRELNMQYSRLVEINRNEIYFPMLTTLDLSHSQHLKNTSNFSRMPNLERLVLEGCINLVKVDRSIGNLKKLSLMNLKDCNCITSLPESICELSALETLILARCSSLGELLDDSEEGQSSGNKENEISERVITLPPKLRILHLGACKNLRGIEMLPSSIQEVDGYKCTSLGTSLWNNQLALSIIEWIKSDPESVFSIVLPGDKIPDCCEKVKECSATGSSLTMELQNLDWYNDDFLGFAVCIVFAPQAGGPQLNPEILCEFNNFTFFYYCGADSVDEFAGLGKRRGKESIDYVWLAYRPRARADRCRPEEWNHIDASFEVSDCVVKKCAIRLIYN